MPLPPAPAKRAALLSLEALPPASPRVRAKPHGRVPVALASASTVEMTEKYDTPDPSFDDSASTDFSTPNRTPAAPRKGRAAKPRDPLSIKLFVMDTNVLMHDPMSLFRFEEHDIYLPMIVLEELDSNKKGVTEVARNARQASRTLDALAAVKGAEITQGLPDRKSTRLNSSHSQQFRMPSSA